MKEEKSPRSTAALTMFLLFAAVLFGLTPAEASIPRAGVAEDGPPLLALHELAPSAIAPSRFGFVQSVWLLDVESAPGCFGLFGLETRRCERTYARNNPLKYVDPDGKKGVVGWVVTLTKTGWERGRKLFTKSETILERAKQLNIELKRSGKGPETSLAWDIEKAAFPGEKHMRHEGHELLDKNGNIIAKGGDHVQTQGRKGHTFFSLLGGLFGFVDRVTSPWDSSAVGDAEATMVPKGTENPAFVSLDLPSMLTDAGQAEPPGQAERVAPSDCVTERGPCPGTN